MSSPSPKPGLLSVTPYVPGAEGEDIAQMIHLASNENPLGCSDQARTAYAGVAHQLHRYPDGSTVALRNKIAETYSLEAEHILCGAGSDELITLILQAYSGPGDEVICSQYGFLIYSIRTHAVGATPILAPETDLKADINALVGVATPETKILFLANPNNPTGTYLTREELVSLRKKLREDILLVIDSAYAEYVDADDYSEGIDLVKEHNNVVMLRTFSKIYGLAALRLGWAYAPADVIDVLNRVRGPFNVCTPAQVAALAALDDQDFVSKSKQHNTVWRGSLTVQLENLGLEVVSSAANFLLVKFSAAEKIRTALKKEKILVRPMGAYGLSDYLRITVGTEEECHALVQAIKKVL